MKKIYFVLLLSIFIINCAPQHHFYLKTVVNPSHSKVKVAVLPENWDYYWVSAFAYRSLITELMDVGFKVIERSNLVSILNEQKLQNSGLVEDRENFLYETRTLDRIKIAKLGKLLGVDKLVLIYVVPSGRKLNMATIRMVDVESSVVLTSTTVIIPTKGEDVDVIMKQVASDIAESIRTRKKIIRRKLFGENQNRKKGDNFLDKIFRK